MSRRPTRTLRALMRGAGVARNLDLMHIEFDGVQEALQKEAQGLRGLLEIDTRLQRIGTVITTGSVALGVMVARDIDLTVVVDRLDADGLAAIAELGANLIQHPNVRQVAVRDDTGTWNTDPAYPDGVYVGVTCRDERGERWSLDLWFVDEPDRQPDISHLSDFDGRITPETQAAILAIKRATAGLRPDGTRLPSYEIYTAVLDGGVTVEEYLRPYAG